MFDRRAFLAAAVAALPAIAEAKKAHKDKQGKKHHDPKAPKDTPKHQHKHHGHKDAPPVDDITDPVVVEPDPTETPEATTEPTLTKKQRRAAKRSSGVSSEALVAVPPAPGADALVTRYYGAPDNGYDAYYPWQFKNDLVIPDKQRSSAWKITDAGPFAGWDIFQFGRAPGVGHLGDGGNAWAEYDVERPVRVGYVWRDAGAKPSWLTAGNGWTVDGTVVAKIQDSRGWVDTLTVYGKEFPKGKIAIPGPVAGNGSGIKQAPWILFAEQGGAQPTMPSGYKPNQTCPDALHDAIKSRDGFPTWHRAFDPASHCLYRHEHGSNPALVFGADTNANMPNYGQIAGLMGMTEIHQGHKGYAIKDWPEADYYIVQHFGTFNVNRMNTCLQRFHLVEVSAMDKQNAHLLYKVRFMADYGTSTGVARGGDNPADDYSLDPPTCPNGNATVGAETGYAQGSRRIPIGVFFDDPNNEAGNSYEPWRFAKRYANTLGIKDAFVVNTIDPLTSIASPTDFTPVEEMDRSGTGRFFTINQTQFGCPNLPASQRNDQGYWFTDPNGLVVYELNNRPANAVRQFCKPGWAGSPVRAAGSNDAAHRSGPAATRWGDAYQIQPGGVPGDFENSITEAHGPN